MFNFFYFIFKIIQGNIWGNIISSTVLKPEVENTTFVPNIAYCGINDCPGSEQSVEIAKPEKSTVIHILAIFLLRLKCYLILNLGLLVVRNLCWLCSLRLVYNIHVYRFLQKNWTHRFKRS